MVEKVKRKYGPDPDRKGDARIAELRKKGYTFRKIAELLGRNVKTVYARYQRHLSTV